MNEWMNEWSLYARGALQLLTEGQANVLIALWSRLCIPCMFKHRVAVIGTQSANLISIGELI